jgi:hypothetical protein
MPSLLLNSEPKEGKHGHKEGEGVPNPSHDGLSHALATEDRSIHYNIRSHCSIAAFIPTLQGTAGMQPVVQMPLQCARLPIFEASLHDMLKPGGNNCGLRERRP